MKKAFLISVLAVCIPFATAQRPLYLDSSRTPEARAHDLVSRMTLEEKAMQAVNEAPAIPRLGVPAYDYWNEGLHGIARSGYSTLFPQAIGMAATWDAPLMKRFGEVVSIEARAKYNDAIQHNNHSIYFGLTVWSPNINIFRDPRWGRGQETYGEDPYLTGLLGLNFIRGLQGPDPLHPRVIATPKHYAVHSGPESDRHRFNVDPSQHDLWDTYLPQFRTAVVDGKAGSIMCAYNALYSQPACASDLLLNKVLREDWKFDGFVTSDCGAVDDFFQKNGHHYSKDREHAAAEGIRLGTDTNCGDTYAALPAAVKQGLVKEAEIDRDVERLFTARFRLGMFDGQADRYARLTMAQDRAPAHLALSLQAARESMVLLKNDGILPLRTARYKTVAVIGPNARSLSALEGNYNAIAKDPVMQADALSSLLVGRRVLYAEGAPYADGVSLPVPSTMFRTRKNADEHGLKAEYFAANAGNPQAAFLTKPVLTRIDRQIDFDWNAAVPVAGLKQRAFAVRWSGYIVPPRARDFEFGARLVHCHPCDDHEHFRITVDGKEVTAYTSSGSHHRGGATPRFHIRFDSSEPVPFVMEYTHESPLFGAGLALEWLPPPGLLQQEAVEAVKKADLVIAMVGLSPELEGEQMNVHVEGFSGGDRTSIDLPASQMKMLDEVAAAGKPLVVVLQNGSALAVGWAQQHANAILEAWYPGEFGGRAIAETLLGRNNPSGRLPVTFYRSTNDLPAFTDYSMKNRTYRYFAGDPLYRFGHGLSYTRFTYSALHLSSATVRAGEPLVAEVVVKNSGKLPGNEVAELYLLPPADGNGGLSPRLELHGVRRVLLQPGEARKLQFHLSPRDLSLVDEKGVRSVQPGTYRIAVGGSQPGDSMATSNIVESEFHIEGSFPLER